MYNPSAQNSVSIIGAGKVAHSLVPAILNAGYKVLSVVSSDKGDANKLSKKYPINISSDLLADIHPQSNLIFLTVPDSEIEATAKKISKLHFSFNKKIFIHCSGAYDISLLENLKKKGASTGSFHIMQTFPSLKKVSIRGCTAAIEANEITVFNKLKKLADKLGLTSFRINQKEKVYYHLAGVFASNFLAGNLYCAELLLSYIKDGNPDMLIMMEKIIRTTILNAKKKGAVKAISGPVERGDLLTIKRHIEALKQQNPFLLKNYILQSINLLQALENEVGKLTDHQQRIREFLYSLKY